MNQSCPKRVEACMQSFRPSNEAENINPNTALNGATHPASLPRRVSLSLQFLVPRLHPQFHLLRLCQYNLTIYPTTIPHSCTCIILAITYVQMELLSIQCCYHLHQDLVMDYPRMHQAPHHPESPPSCQPSQPILHFRYHHP